MIVFAINSDIFFTSTKFLQLYFLFLNYSDFQNLKKIVENVFLPYL